MPHSKQRERYENCLTCKKKHKTPRWKIMEETTMKNGLRHAVYTASGNSVYIGEWKNNQKSGKGIEIRHKKYIYEGDWLNGMKHGYGIFSIENDLGVRVMKYEGEWKFDKADGYGTIHYEDGTVYEGLMKEGHRGGHGRMWHSDNTFYEGEWLHGKHHGNGLICYPNGDFYEGFWADGLKNGKGKFYHMSTGQIQSGAWVNDIPVVCMMYDSGGYRQAAVKPTPFPIPKNELNDMEKSYSRREESILVRSRLMGSSISEHNITNTDTPMESTGDDLILT